MLFLSSILLLSPPTLTLALTLTLSTIIMSTTATQTRAQQELLHDYDIHLTTSVAPASTSFPHAPPSRDAPRPLAENPVGWTDDWRQTPPYRPVNRGLDRELRPWGTNPVEQGFIVHMFEGVLLQAVGFFFP